MDNFITLNDESGTAVEFEFLDLVEYEGNEYVVLLPADDPDDSEEVVILQLEATDEGAEEEIYSGVEDYSILDAVFEIFKARFKDEFIFLED